MSVEITSRGIRVGGEEMPLVSGTIHYWRLERDAWEPCLDRVAEMGFRIVETYVPWSVHEVEPGRFDFGETDARKDVAAFARLVQSKGLKLLVRPGPHINAEITYFGYPKRLFADPRLLARTADGTPAVLPAFPRMFPVPSYASEVFYDEARVYLEAAAHLLAPLQYPEGPIVGVQTDNEMSFFFRTALFDLDYADGSIWMYRRAVERRYGEVADMNRVYGTSFRDFEELDPPRRFDPDRGFGIAYWLDWAAHKESLLRYGLRRIAEILRTAGLDRVPVTHNFPPISPGSPVDIPSAERDLDVVGVDLYSKREDYRFVRMISRYLAGSSRLPYVPEFSSGCYLWWKPITFHDQRFTTWTPFMHGLRAINFYMIVDRERWYGAPVARDGRVRARYFELFKTFHRVLARSGILSKRKKTPVLVLNDVDYGRLELATSLLDPAPPIVLEALGLAEGRVCSEDALGFSKPIQLENPRIGARIAKSLDAAQIPFDQAPTTVDPARLGRYGCVVLPTFEFLDTGVQELLVDHAREGGTVVIGPLIPDRDPAGTPSRAIEDALEAPLGGLPSDVPGASGFALGKGRVVVLNDPDAALGDGNGLWARLGIDAPVRWRGRGVDATLFEPEPGAEGTRIVFIANPTDRAVRARVDLAGAQGARELIGDTDVDMKDLYLDPYTIRILEIAE
ncbi:MAG: beta-galactosidase [Myxococcales bacterium]|nr:beta-galactosidase [Myxococcales bacterium]